MIYANPNTTGAVVNFKKQYQNFIGGEWVAPVKRSIPRCYVSSNR